MSRKSHRSTIRRLVRSLVLLGVVALGMMLGVFVFRRITAPDLTRISLAPRKIIDTSGYFTALGVANQWKPTDSLQQIAKHWERAGYRAIEQLGTSSTSTAGPASDAIELLCTKAEQLMYEGAPDRALAVLAQARSRAERDESLAREWLSTIMFFQGVAALRRGENENCIMCRGESSCILPISAAAVHQKPKGSRLAIKHFSEYLNAIPDDLEAQWLLNVAHMTLGEYPDKVDARYLIRLDKFLQSEVDIGRFRDIGELVGVNRLNQAGGAIMDDFDKDGLLDIVVTSIDPNQVMALYRNKGDGTFEDRTEAANLSDQLGGLNCVQTDYDNDGLLDIYIPRGAWQQIPMRPSLLRNEGQGRFRDVTDAAGLLDPVNSNAAAWADYDNDGWLDLFVCCERQPNRLFRNLGSGAFQNVTAEAGIVTGGDTMDKGCTWIDYDNDDFADLFINQLAGTGQLFRNNRNGTFTNVTDSMGIDGPRDGFACWAWDYDNDGWQDIFATCYDRTLADVVRGLIGEPHERHVNRLFRNLNGTGFRDTTWDVGLGMVFATMGSNFGDFDNDGYLDMYLGTGDPNVSMLVPNRMFKNIAGGRFAEITSSAGVGHLQKGHGVACGDWDRDGNVDIFIEMGGTIPGDKYHNILFQNPGHDNRWLTVKLVGDRTNRAAIGARVKVVTAAEPPLTVFRHVSSGSSFGGNPLQQTIGLGNAERIALIEVRWPKSGTTQVFRDVAVNQAIEITEFADDFRVLDWPRVSKRWQ